jgi:hypothetical protein
MMMWHVEGQFPAACHSSMQAFLRIMGHEMNVVYTVDHHDHTVWNTDTGIVDKHLGILSKISNSIKIDGVVWIIDRNLQGVGFLPSASCFV